MPKAKPKAKQVSPEVEAKRIDFASLNIEQLKDEAVQRGIDFTGMQTRTKIIDAIMEYEEKRGREDRMPRVEMKMGQGVIDKAKEVTDYDRKQVAATPFTGTFQIIELKGGRTALLNKRKQIVAPIAVAVQEQSDLRRMERDMNMKDPEQKPYNRLLPDTPRFPGAGSTPAPEPGTVMDEAVGQLNNPIPVDPSIRGKGRTQV